MRGKGDAFQWTKNSRFEEGEGINIQCPLLGEKGGKVDISKRREKGGVTLRRGISSESICEGSSILHCTKGRKGKSKGSEKRSKNFQRPEREEKEGKGLFFSIG